MADSPETAEDQAAAQTLRLADRLRTDCRLAYPANATQTVASVGLCGVGNMGAGIHAACLKHSIPVKLYDAAPEAIARGLQVITEDLLSNAPDVCPDRNKLAPEPVDLETLLTTADQLSDLGSCELVIESVVENRELKQRVLRQLESIVPADTILATNTSTIAISELDEVLNHADRFCGIHFFNPVRQRALVEVARADHTSDATIATAVAYATRIGKLPIVVRDSPGFLVNRLLVPYMNEALEMVCAGVNIRTIDKAARKFGMPIGPLALFDLIGVDTAMLGGRTLWEAFPDRITLTPILPALVKRGRLGRKTRAGFYRYNDDRGNGQRVDPEFAPIVEPYIRHRAQPEHDDLVLRLLLPMLIEATRAIEDKVVSSTADVDVGVLFGLAFPSFRGGLLYWADQIGPRRILELLKPFEPLGKRMQPTEMLLSLAAHDGQFLVDH